VDIKLHGMENLTVSNNLVYVVIGYYSSGAASISEDLGDIYLYDSLDKAEEVVRIWEESNPYEYSRWEIEEKKVE